MMTNEIYKPMLAHVYEKKQKHATFPGYVQPKLDGVRLCWNGYDMISRTGKPIEGLPKLHATLLKHFSGVPLDGELFSREMTFQEIVASVRRSKNIEEDERIGFWVYDTPNDMPFSRRAKLLGGAVRGIERVVPVETHVVNSEEELMWWKNRFEDAGYEGAMYRSADGPYECGKRSNHLLKLKSFKDCEARAIGMIEGKGKHKGRLGAVIVEKNGVRFKVGSGFTDDQRKNIWANYLDYDFKIMTVKYQELTTGGVPRFPTFVEWRDYE